MKRYIRIYRSLCAMSWNTLVAYRANFINSLVSSAAWGIFAFISIFLLTSKTNIIYGWTRGEIILLTCGYQILIGIFHTLFTRNFERMSEIIEYAQLDSYLLKPIDSQFYLSMRWINYSSTIRVFLGIGFFFYTLQILHISLTVLNFLNFFLLLMVGLLLLYSLWFTVATLLLWFPRLSNIVDLMFQVSGMTRYPGELYKHASGFLFVFLLPILLIVTTSVKFLVQKVSIVDIVELLFFMCLFFVLSRKFWKFALRFYASASG